jgi:hypothetical protein
MLSPVTAAPAAAAQDTPLAVSIDSMSPSVIPRSGRITVTGEVTNRSNDTWSDLKVYLLSSQEPFTTSSELEAASATDPALEIGERLFREGLYDEVGELAPGASTSYTLSIPRAELPAEAPGAYWLGVHVLGQLDGQPRDAVADGRARTFVPLMATGGPSTSMSLLVPVRATVKRNADGSLSQLERWQQLLGPEGRLGRLMELSDSSSDQPFSWVVDPAVLDAAQSVARDNPPLDSGPSDEEGTPSASSGPSPSPSDDSTEEPSGSEEPELSDEAELGADWLESFVRQAAEHAVLATSYGDVDLASMTHNDFAQSYQQAADLTAATMEGYGVTASPVVAPPSGYLPTAALTQIDTGTPLVLGDAAAPTVPGPLTQSRRGHRIVLTDLSAGMGGPGPTRRARALDIRQRLLSEAAVHALGENSTQTLVVSTPQSWDPGRDWESAGFFSGLDVPWLRLVGLPVNTAGVPTERHLVYPRRETRAELPTSNLLASQDLVGVGGAYADLLTRNDTVDESLAKAAMLGSSYRVRNRPRPAATRTRDTGQLIRSRMEQVRIEGPSFVTMSSEDGPIGVTIVNGLQEPVTVGIEAIVGDTTSGDLQIRPADPVTIGPGQRASVQLRARADDIGVHSVTLVPTNSNGVRLGSSTNFNVRSSQVGLVIWVIMGVGAAVLLIASAVRIVRRIRGRKATHGPLLKETTP